MKNTLILAAAVLAGIAHADTLLTAPNSAGGEIRLTNNTAKACPPGYWAAYSTGADVNDPPGRGCWRIVDMSAHVMWDSGSERMFPLERFKFTDYGWKLYGDKKPHKGAL